MILNLVEYSLFLFQYDFRISALLWALKDTLSYEDISN